MSRLRSRFDRPVSAAMERFASSLDVDLPLAPYEIRASIAHARMLGDTGILDAAEADRLVTALEQIGEELTNGDFRPQPADEDIHMAVERRLGELTGELAGHLHTARSRNDQIATLVRMWARDHAAELDAVLAELLRALLERVRSDGRTLLPGYTHLQRGQPVLLGHHLLAHAWHLARDRRRLEAARERLDACPLGAGALAGTPHPIDREATARELGFSAPAENAMDAVAARDHLQELAAVCAIAMSGLSRQAEELVLWSSSEFGFVALSEEYATGSSIMPQKRNPDAAELVRGRTGRVFAALQSLLVLTKGLPLAYNRDLQEDRRPLYDAVETTRDCAAILAAVWRGLTVRSERFAAELAADSLLATELADALVVLGAPFRRAHESVGKLVRRLEAEGRRFDELTEEELGELHPELGGRRRELLDPLSATDRRRSHGGTAWSEIERQLRMLEDTV